MNKFTVITVLILFALIVCTSCNKKGMNMNKENLTTTIIAMEKAALEEWNRGNPSGYLDIYAEDITYFDPFQEKRIDGFEKMQAFYESLRGSVQADSYEMIDPVVEFADEMAVLSYNLTSNSGGVTYRWNCSEVYQLQPDKQWKIIHNHWSFTRPMDIKS
jgi:ketosteroid isomerase-like protein